MGKIRFIALKEFYHILRDPRSLTIAIIMPIMMTFLYGYAITLDIQEIELAVLDQDNSSLSRELVDKFYASGYFIKPDKKIELLDMEQYFRSGNASAVLTIPSDFTETIEKLEQVSLGMMVDGADNNFASAVQNYSNAVILEFAKEQIPPEYDIPNIRMAVKVLYNPDLKSSHFFVPGLVAIILLMICALLTSITIAREKETGTMEQLLTAPVNPVQIISGKVLPYIVLAFIDGILILLFAKFLFNVPFVGSKLLLLGFGILYIITSLSLGILISSLVKTQQVAMMFALVTTLLPSIMLSGFIFAIKNMPIFLQVLSNIISAKFFMTIIRGIMLKGAGLEILAIQGIYLIILTSVIMVIASLNFTTRID